MATCLIGQQLEVQLKNGSILYTGIFHTVNPDKDFEIQALEESVQKEIEDDSKDDVTIKKMLKSKAVRRALYAGVRLQIFQQFVGVNTVMYFSPTIVQLADFISNRVALLLSLITSGLNAFGSIISIYSIDKIGRRNLVLVSLVVVVLAHTLLFGSFYRTEKNSPMVSPIETSHFNSTCPAYASTSSPGSWDCMKCLKASPSCGFCADQSNKGSYERTTLVNKIRSHRWNLFGHQFGRNVLASVRNA